MYGAFCAVATFRENRFGEIMMNLSDWGKLISSMDMFTRYQFKRKYIAYTYRMGLQVAAADTVQFSLCTFVIYAPAPSWTNGCTATMKCQSMNRWKHDELEHLEIASVIGWRWRCSIRQTINGINLKQRMRAKNVCFCSERNKLYHPVLKGLMNWLLTSKSDKHFAWAISRNML